MTAVRSDTVIDECRMRAKGAARLQSVSETATVPQLNGAQEGCGMNVRVRQMACLAVGVCAALLATGISSGSAPLAGAAANGHVEAAASKTLRAGLAAVGTSDTNMLAGGALDGEPAVAEPADSSANCTFNGQDPEVDPILSGVTAGESIALACSGFLPDHTIVAAEISPLWLTSGTTGDVDFTDVATGTTNSAGSYAGTFVVPNPFVAANPDAACPPTAAQVNEGYLRCGLVVTDGTNGSVIALDYATSSPSPAPGPPPAPASPAVGMAATADGNGYWIATADGGVYSYGDAAFYGSMAGQALNAPITHIVSTPDGKGYWLVAGDGGTFSFGDAGFYGSMGGMPLNAPVVDIAPTRDGAGYWLVASDGGIFAFGDAAFYGSMGGRPLNKPVVGIAADDATGGYWEVATDGGIFAFNAPFYGSTGNLALNKPVNGMTPTNDDDGYWFVASDGGLFAYGDAGFHGSAVGVATSTVVGMTADPATGGYWILTRNGSVYSYGAPFFGSE
ncbi:MAG: hypothetical protein ACRDZR_01405 [Acidimicrobiales bacterium]